MPASSSAMTTPIDTMRRMPCRRRSERKLDGCSTSLEEHVGLREAVAREDLPRAGAQRRGGGVSGRGGLDGGLRERHVAGHGAPVLAIAGDGPAELEVRAGVVEPAGADEGADEG